MALSAQFKADLVTFTSGAADVETAVTHSLGYTPLEGFVTWQGGSGNLYRSTTAWTSTTVYVKSSDSGVSYMVYLV